MPHHGRNGLVDHIAHLDRDSLLRPATHTQQGLADRLGALAAFGGFVDGLVGQIGPILGQLGVVDDRGEDVVELVGDHGRHSPDGRQTLSTAKFLAKGIHLNIEPGELFLVRFGFGRYLR